MPDPEGAGKWGVDTSGAPPGPIRQRRRWCGRRRRPLARFMPPARRAFSDRHGGEVGPIVPVRVPVPVHQHPGRRDRPGASTRPPPLDLRGTMSPADGGCRQGRDNGAASKRRGSPPGLRFAASPSGPTTATPLRPHPGSEASERSEASSHASSASITPQSTAECHHRSWERILPPCLLRRSRAALALTSRASAASCGLRP